MSADDGPVAIAREWAQKAENDLRTAAHTLKLGKACPTDTVCFHAQQCVEKYIKALLTLVRRDFPRTHSIDLLLARLPPELRPELSPEDQDRLTEYATVVRYPGEYDPILLPEARRAVALARKVRKEVTGRLPRAVLRPTRR